jgi:hypothetical protein
VGWTAPEVAEILESVNSALQRARATIEQQLPETTRTEAHENCCRGSRCRPDVGRRRASGTARATLRGFGRATPGFLGVRGPVSLMG